MCDVRERCECLDKLRSQFVTVKDMYSKELKTEDVISRDEKLYKAGMLIGLKKAIGLVDEVFSELGNLFMIKCKK